MINMKCIEVLILCFVFYVSTVNASGDIKWELIGPGDADQVTSLSISDTGDVFMGTDIGGIYHSSNSGASWKPVNHGLKNLDITTPVLIADNSGKALFVGTRGGLYKSQDGGENWVNIRNGLPISKKSSLTGSVGSIEQNPLNFSQLYLGMGYRPSSAGNSTISKLKWLNYIFVSNDNGEHWQPLPPFGNEQKVNQIVASEINNNVVYVVGDKGIYKSNDAGLKWKRIYAGQAINLLEFKNKPELLVASTAGTGIIRSLDDGITWTNVKTGLSFYNLSKRHTNRYSVLVSSPKSPGVIYLTNSTWGGSGGLYKSTDFGESWTKVTSKLPESWLKTSRRMNSVAVSRNNIYLGSSRYIYQSDDGGESWTQLISKKVDKGWTNTGINIFGHTRVAKTDPGNQAIIYIGTADHGLVRSTDNGISWNPIGKSLNYADNVWDIDTCQKRPGYLFIISSNIKGKLCMYTGSDNGESWESYCDGLGKSNRNEKIYVEPKSCTTTYIASSEGLMRGDNRRGKWHTIFAQDNITVNDMAFDPVNNQHIYLATNKGIYKSINKGLDWELLQGLNDKKITSVHVSTKNPSVLLAGSSISSKNKAAIYKSRNRGSTWKIVKWDLGKYVSAITQNIKFPDSLYASINDYNYHDEYIDSGLYESNDHGESWQPVQNGLPKLRAFNVNSDYSGARVFLSTQGSGVYLREQNKE